MKIAIIGTGYLGLVMGGCLADRREVTCVDVNASRIAQLNGGGIPFYEPGLAEGRSDDPRFDVA